VGSQAADGTVASDELTINSTAVQVQRIKLVAGKDGTYTGDVAGRNVDGDANASAIFVDARPSIARKQATSAGLTTATTAYSLDDQLGTILSWTSAVRASGGTGLITGVQLLDKANVVGAVDLYLFNQSVTLQSDNAQADFSDADMMFCVSIVPLPAPVRAKSSSPSNQLSAVSCAVPIECVGSTTLYGALVTRSGHTFFGAVGDLVVSLFIAAD